MTVEELAKSSGHSVKNVLKALSLLDNEVNYKSNSIFEDPSMLYNTVRKLGLKFKVVKPPSEVVEEVIEDYDAVRR